MKWCVGTTAGIYIDSRILLHTTLKSISLNFLNASERKHYLLEVRSVHPGTCQPFVVSVCLLPSKTPFAENKHKSNV